MACGVTQESPRGLDWSTPKRDDDKGKFVICDRDTKFTAFDAVFRSHGVAIIQTPVQAPNAKAFAGQWRRTMKEDCLDSGRGVGRSSPR